MSADSTPLARILADRILRKGPMTFADYMTECLYHPEHGYYNSPQSIERHRDYYTSVDVHPIFARLIARQLAEMWDATGKPDEFYVVETGAGTGDLAVEILEFAKYALPEWYESLHYFPVEQSIMRKKAQSDLFRKTKNTAHVLSEWVPPGQDSAACFLSNELFDALPVHRVIRERGELREIYVALNGNRLCDQTGPISTYRLSNYFREQKAELKNGQQAEVCLLAENLFAGFDLGIARSFALTIDYGHEATELYNERHMRGTLLAYQNHRATEDFYAAPGLQDLTAYVNFTALDLAGRRAGFTRTGLVSQTNFLMALGKGNEFADLYDPDDTEADKVRARLLLKNLIYPEGMGETFKVLIQHKGIKSPRLTGLLPL